MRQRRRQYQNDPAEIIHILRDGAERVNAIANNTLDEVRAFIHQRF